MDTWELIDTRMKVMDRAYKKMDKVRKRLNQTPHVMYDYPDEEGIRRALSDVIIVTENKSSSYMKRVISTLLASKWQGLVEGLTERENHKIERFTESCFQQADEYLMAEYGMPTLDYWLANHVCHTSIIITEWIVSVEDGEYKVRCRPCDGRWTPYVLGKWVAPITYETKDDLLKILETYEKDAVDSKGEREFTKLADLKDDDNEVRNFWNGEKNELLVNNKLVFAQKNPYGKPPYAIGQVSGFMFRDRGYIENEFPSVLSPNEDLFDQLSDQLSIDATLGRNVLRPATESERDNIAADQKSSVAPRPGENLDVPPGGRHLPVPTPDINHAELASREQVSGMIEGAAPSTPRQYTTPPSAIEVATEVELIDQLQAPRIEALQAFKSQLSRLNIEQVLIMAGKDGSMLAGSTGRQGSFTVTDLKDPKKYAIKYKMLKRNKRMSIVNEQRYIALKATGAPEEFLLKDVLEVEDVDGWMRADALQKAEKLNPALTYKRMALYYAEKADDATDEIAKADYVLSWKLMVHEYVQIMRQRMNVLPTNETEAVREAVEPKGNTAAISSLGRTGGGMPQLTGAQKGVTL